MKYNTSFQEKSNSRERSTLYDRVGRPGLHKSEKGSRKNIFLYSIHQQKLKELSNRHNCSQSFILQSLIENYADRLSEVWITHGIA